MSIGVKTSFCRAISSLVYRPVPSVFAFFYRQIFDTFSIFAACYRREAIFGKIETTQFLGISTVPVPTPLSVFGWRSYFLSYWASKTTLYFWRIFLGGSHTLFETVGKPKMRSTASCWPSKSRVPRKKFRSNRTGRFGAARLGNLVTPLSGCVSAALWLLSGKFEMDLLGSFCAANVGPSPVVGESHRANRVWMWEKNKRVFSFRCQNGASQPKSDLL